MSFFSIEALQPFYQNITSFPTAIFTVFFIVCLFYWIVAIIGFVDLDALDTVFGNATDSSVSINHEIGSPDALAGLMLRFGLNGVPVTVMVTSIVILGWFICYYLVHFFFDDLDGLLRYAAGIPVFLISFGIAVVISAQMIKPLRPFFKKTEQQLINSRLGQIAKVRSSRVDKNFGEAILENDGISLLLKVRTADENIFNQGDRVVILEYLDAENIYLVTSKESYKQNNPE